jgi:hypothetical protein
MRPGNRGRAGFPAQGDLPGLCELPARAELAGDAP